MSVRIIPPTESLSGLRPQLFDSPSRGELNFPLLVRQWSPKGLLKNPVSGSAVWRFTQRRRDGFVGTGRDLSLRTCMVTLRHSGLEPESILTSHRAWRPRPCCCVASGCGMQRTRLSFFVFDPVPARLGVKTSERGGEKAKAKMDSGFRRNDGEGARLGASTTPCRGSTPLLPFQGIKAPPPTPP